MFMTPPEKPAFAICLTDSCSHLVWAEAVASNLPSRGSLRGSVEKTEHYGENDVFWPS
jgi:hypothetical protein